MNELITIQGIRGRMNADGNPELNLEDVARGYGFTRIAASGNEVVRWERVRGYLEELGVVPTSGHGANVPTGREGLPEYIPENIFYLLGFKASNETARKFQLLVANEILPAIRKHGGYLTSIKIEEILSDPDTLIRLATDLKAEREKGRALLAENNALTAKAEDLEVRLSESEKFWTIMKFNQHFNLRWNMELCQRNGKRASVYSRQRGYEIRKCQTNDERFKETNSYAYEVLERLFLAAE